MAHAGPKGVDLDAAEKGTVDIRRPSAGLGKLQQDDPSYTGGSAKGAEDSFTGDKLGAGQLERSHTLMEFEEGAPFQDGWREWSSSLPWTSWLFLAVSVVDVALVWAYCGWAVNRPNGSIEESLHIALALAITAVFFIYFVIDGVVTENVFELTAALVLDGLVLARVLFYVIVKKKTRFPGRIVLLSFITAFQLFVLFLAFWTVLQFGWRIFSRLAIDFRKKDAQQRLRLYLSRALFLTFEKLDLQFLIIMYVVAIVIWVKNHQCETCREPTWFIVGYNTFLFVVNILVAAAAWFAVKFPDKLKWGVILVDFPLMPISLIQPIANIAWEFKRHEDIQNAKASMAVVCGCFIMARVALWIMMHVVKHYTQVVQRVDQGAADNLKEEDKSLLPLMRGAWLGKPSAKKPNKRRFFQLSADGASLRWSWRKYVRLFYLEAMDVDRETLTLTLKFTTDPDLTLKFPNKTKFRAWTRALESLVGNLMSPGVARGGMPGHPATAAGAGDAALIRPSLLGRASMAPVEGGPVPAPKPAAGTDRRANRNFLSHMVGIVIRDKHPGGLSSRQTDIELAVGELGHKQPREMAAAQTGPVLEEEEESSDEEEIVNGVTVMKARKQESMKAQKQPTFDPNKLFDFADNAILEAMSPEGGGLGSALQSGAGLNTTPSTASSGIFKLPSGVRSGGLENVEYDDLEFGKLLGAGAEGEVYAAWWRESMVAVKRFNRACDSIHELRMHTAVSSGDNQNVLSLKGYCRSDDAVFLIMEYCPRGTLDVLIHNTRGRPWSMEKLLPVVRSTAAGLRSMHCRNRAMLHRDIKPGNIFVSSGQTMKIGDFGMSRYVDMAEVEGGGPPQLSRLTPNVIGTAQYAAPEIMNEDLMEAMRAEQRYLQADVYSFGVTLWELLERKRPYKGMDPYQIQTLSIINPEELRLPVVKVPDSLDAPSRAAWAQLAALVDTCTVTAADKRPTIEEVYNIICRIQDNFLAAGGK